MNIVIRGRNVPLSDSLQDYCRDRARRALAPSSDRVTRVEIVLVSLSGLHNTPIIACRVFVTLKSGERLMFESSERDHYLAVSRATFGAGRHLARRVAKWRTAARAYTAPMGAA